MNPDTVQPGKPKAPEYLKQLIREATLPPFVPMTIPCKNCWKEFTQYRRGHKFCSIVCGRQWWLGEDRREYFRAYNRRRRHGVTRRGSE